ncbi:MAG: hypothetical protein ACK4PK_06990 [Alphaproteobacteria bacterium]
MIIQNHNLQASPMFRGAAACAVARGGALNQQDPWTWLAGTVDAALMLFYAHLRRNARRLSRLAFAMLPLAVLLVGSCKTYGSDNIYGNTDAPAMFRLALFPDSRHALGDDYRPARGYVASARKYIAGEPAALTRLTEREIGYLFGKPSLERRDADARIWQYRTEGCVVDVYFYKNDTQKSGYDVSYVDFRSGEQLKVGGPIAENPAAPKSQSRCLRTLVGHGAAPARA